MLLCTLLGTNYSYSYIVQSLYYVVQSDMFCSSAQLGTLFSSGMTPQEH